MAKLNTTTWVVSYDVNESEQNKLIRLPLPVPVPLVSIWSIKACRRPDGVKKQIVVIVSSFPHRKPFKTSFLDVVAFGSKRLRIVERNHDFGRSVVNVRLQ